MWKTISFCLTYFIAIIHLFPCCKWKGDNRIVYDSLTRIWLFEVHYDKCLLYMVQFLNQFSSQCVYVPECVYEHLNDYHIIYLLLFNWWENVLCILIEVEEKKKKQMKSKQRPNKRVTGNEFHILFFFHFIVYNFFSHMRNWKEAKKIDLHWNNRAWKTFNRRDNLCFTNVKWTRKQFQFVVVSFCFVCTSWISYLSYNTKTWINHLRMSLNFYDFSATKDPLFYENYSYSEMKMKHF